jgi:predicted transposase YbfD/YdcC
MRSPCCQTAIASQIRAQGGDYLLALKGNHKKAYTAVKQYFHEHIEHQLAWRTAEHFFDAFDDSHGRTVRRRVWTITDLTALPALAKWSGLQAAIVVETIRAAYPGAPITSDYFEPPAVGHGLRHDDSPTLGHRE